MLDDSPIIATNRRDRIVEYLADTEISLIDFAGALQQDLTSCKLMRSILLLQLHQALARERRLLERIRAQNAIIREYIGAVDKRRGA